MEITTDEIFKFKHLKKEYPTKNEALKNAKLFLLCGAYDLKQEREWKHTNLTSYSDLRYLVEFYMLEGSPHRGLIIVDNYTKQILIWIPHQDIKKYIYYRREEDANEIAKQLNRV